MNASAPHVVAAILWVSPLIQTLATLAFLLLATSFRRSVGAQNMHTGMFAVIGVVALLLHTGYFLAPLWWRSGRHLLGAATMLPVALLVLGSIVIVVTQTDIVKALTRSAAPLRLAVFAGAGALILAYLGPLVLMLAASA